MELDIASLRALMAVVDLGGMTKAAEELHISQPAVSWKIKRLEEKVGRPLLVREGRSLRPSRDGRELLEYARSIVATHDEAVARLSGSDLTGTLRLGTNEEAVALCMEAVYARFARIHPGVTITFDVERSLRLDAMLRRGELDVAVMQVGIDQITSMDTVLWLDQPVWVCSPEWTYEEGVVPLITFGESGFYRPLAQEKLAEAAVPYRVVFSGPSSASVISAAEAGVGVALVSSSSVSDTVIEWPRQAELGPMPDTVQVARPSPGEPSTVAAELIIDLAMELGQVDLGS